MKAKVAAPKILSKLYPEEAAKKQVTAQQSHVSAAQKLAKVKQASDSVKKARAKVEMLH